MTTDPLTPRVEGDGLSDAAVPFFASLCTVLSTTRARKFRFLFLQCVVLSRLFVFMAPFGLNLIQVGAMMPLQRFGT